MIANELRIGNYVYFKHCDYKLNVPRKINYTLKPNLVGLERVSVNSIEYNHIEGIPLTESLISEICFNENKVMGMYRLQLTDDYTIAFSLDNDMIYIGDDIEIRISKTPLHRLQNLYLALSGKELPLEL